MSKEEAIAFLQEIKFNIDYLRAHYSQNMKAAEESAQQEKLRNLLIEQAKAKVRTIFFSTFFVSLYFNQLLLVLVPHCHNVQRGDEYWTIHITLYGKTKQNLIT